VEEATETDKMEEAGMLEGRTRRQPWVRQRARDSSFSLDTDEEFFYSSPSDEEDFVSKEFRRDYDNVNVDRLSALEKTDLIVEYMIMEKRVEELKKRLEEVRVREEAKARAGEADYEFFKGEVPMSPPTAQKIRVFQSEINKLNIENISLRKENSHLRTQLSGEDKEDGSSSSSTTTASSSSSEGEDVDDDGLGAPEEDLVANKVEDVGYESGQSSSVSSSEIHTSA